MMRWVWGGAVLVVTFALASSCDSTEEAILAALGQGCLLDSDCDAELVCVFQRCHQQCDKSGDCPAGLSCRVGEPPTHVCQLVDESNCALHSDCPPKQVCGPDLVCRDECLADPDCVSGQQCAQKLCAEPAELVGGELPVGGDQQGEGQPCAVNSECQTPLLCLAGRCLFECQENSDCPSDQCIDNRCVPVFVPPPCVPGNQVDCSSECSGTNRGVKLCQSDLTWGDCNCLGGGTGGAGGGAGGGGGMGGSGGMGAPPCTVSMSSTVVAKGFAGSREGHLAFNSVSNEVMIAGVFEQQTDFGGGPVSPQGPNDLFLARYDSNLNYVGAVTYGSIGTDTSGNVVTDTSGNAIISGYTQAAFTYPGGSALSGPWYEHLIKVDQSGNHIWSMQITAGSHADRDRVALGTDANDNIFVAGAHTGNIDWGGLCAPLPGGSFLRWYVAKFNSSGVCQWSVGTPNIGDLASLIGDLAVDSNGDVVIVGSASNAVDFGGGTLNSIVQRDAVVVRYSGANGAHLGSWRYGSGTASYATTVATVGTDIVVGFGAFGTVNLDLGNGPDACPDSACSWMVRYDAAGNHVWQHRMNGGSTETQIAVDANGDAYWWGNYQGAANMLGTCTMPATGTTQPPFVMRVLADGTVWWVEGYSTTQNGFLDYPGLAVSPGGDIFGMAGIANGSINVDFGMGVMVVGSAFIRLTP